MAHRKHTLSVILTVYNLASILRETLESIRKQTLFPDELIIVNDGSTDNTLSLCLDFAKEYKNATIINQSNQGPGAARNEGIRVATGEYLLILDGDDIFDSRFFEKMVAYADKYQPDIVCCRSSEFERDVGDSKATDWTIDAQYLPCEEYFHTEELRGMSCLAFNGWAWDKMFNRKLIENFDIKFPSLKNSEDGVFVYPAIAFSRDIAIVEENLIKHRINRYNSVSKSRGSNLEDFYKSICLIKEKLRTHVDVWEREYRGFINWAIKFTNWAIRDGVSSERLDRILSKIRGGAYPELEVYEHPREFFRDVIVDYCQIVGDKDVGCFSYADYYFNKILSKFVFGCKRRRVVSKYKKLKRIFNYIKN